MSEGARKGMASFVAVALFYLLMASHFAQPSKSLTSDQKDRYMADLAHIAERLAALNPEK